MKRIVVFTAAILLQLCLGSILGWSILAKSLQSDYGLTAGRTGFVFGLYIAVFTCGNVLGGRVLERLGCRRTGLVGALMVGSGWLLSGLSDGQFPMLILGTSLCTGLGNGFCYISALVACVKWFPKAPGRATGAAVAGTGAGAILVTTIAEAMLADGYGVLSVFRFFAGLNGSVMFLCAALLFVPPTGTTAPRQKVPLRQLLAARHFWALFLGLFGGTFPALLVMGHLKNLGIEAGQEPQVAAAAVGLYAVGNALGRVGWGFVYDHLGRRAIVLSLLSLLTALLLLFASGSTPVFLANAVWFGASFGATMVVYASDVSVFWGHDRVSSVYPFIYLAYGVAGVASPGPAGWLRDASDSYTAPILLAAAVVAVCTAVYWLLTRPGHDASNAAAGRQ
jgi:OFA family oxalate/formate antiporter-like MFS transporter